jgi:hypothetical protein
MTGEREPQPIGRHYRPPHSHAPVTRGWVVCRRCTASSATRTTRTNLSAVHQPRGPSLSLNAPGVVAAAVASLVGALSVFVTG